MKRFLQIGSYSVALLFLISGCSSQPVTQEGVNPGITAAADAGTDAVPANSPVAALAAQAAQAATPNAPPIAPQVAKVAAPSGDAENYTVSTGDTLMKIAFDHYGDLYRWKDIYDLNKDHITNPTALSTGIVLKLERPSASVAVAHNGEKYLIQEGNTLGTISNDVYGMNTKWKRLWENNRQLIKNPNRIFAGFNLYYTFTDQDRMEKESVNPVTNPLSSTHVPDSNRVVAAAAVPTTVKPVAQAPVAVPSAGTSAQ